MVSQKKEKQKGVTFGNVTIHMHMLTLGDNPGGTTRDGPPLTIEWKSNDTIHFDCIDEYNQTEHDAITKYYHMKIHQGVHETPQGFCTKFLFKMKS